MAKNIKSMKSAADGSATYAEAYKTLGVCSIVAHVHDELIIEAEQSTSLDEICRVMGTSPVWARDLLLRADGYVCDFYMKD